MRGKTTTAADIPMATMELGRAAAETSQALVPPKNPNDMHLIHCRCLFSILSIGVLPITIDNQLSPSPRPGVSAGTMLRRDVSHCQCNPPQSTQVTSPSNVECSSFHSSPTTNTQPCAMVRGKRIVWIIPLPRGGDHRSQNPDARQMKDIFCPFYCFRHPVPALSSGIQ